MLCKKKRKGQSTVEYLVLVAAVIAVILLFVGNQNSPFRTKLNGVLDSATNSMTNMAGRLNRSYPVAP